VMRQARQRVLHGNTHVPGKLLSVFETCTEVIRKGKTSKPNEFGKLVRIQEAENQHSRRLQSYGWQFYGRKAISFRSPRARQFSSL